MKAMWVVVMAVWLAGVAAAPASKGGEPRVDGARLEFRLPDLDGNLVGSDDPRFEGKVILVELWGTWCPPCLTEIPTLIDLQKRHGERGLIVLAIAFEEREDAGERRKALRAFSEAHRINYLVLDGGSTSDFETALPAVRNVRGLPVEIIVDRQGRVVTSRNGYGYKKRWARKLERELVELLESSPDGH